MNNSLIEWDASVYEKNSTPQRVASLMMIDTYQFIGHEKILDLGCGDGKLTAYLAQKVPQGSVIGLDQSSNMIQLAKQYIKDHKNLTFIQSDVQTFELNTRFDLITSFFCLMWAKNKGLAFSKIFQHLEPGGTALLVMSGGGKYFHKPIQETYLSKKWRGYFDHFDDPFLPIYDRDYKKYAIQSSLEIKYFDTKPNPVEFNSQSEISGFLRPLYIHLNQVPKEKREELFNDTLNCHLSYTKNQKNPYYFDCRYIFMVCTKPRDCAKSL